MLSHQDDMDGRYGERRKMIDSYKIHADEVDQIRLSLKATIRQMSVFLDREDDIASYWYDELWVIEHTCRSLGIED